MGNPTEDTEFLSLDLVDETKQKQKQKCLPGAQEVDSMLRDWREPKGVVTAGRRWG